MSSEDLTQQTLKNWKTLGFNSGKYLPVSAFVKEAQENIMRTSPSLQYISVPQLTSSLDGLSKPVLQQEWKNIPHPTVEAINSMYSSIDYLKRFCLMLDFRVNQAVLSTNQSCQDLYLHLENFNAALQQELNTGEERILRKLQSDTETMSLCLTEAKKQVLKEVQTDAIQRSEQLTQNLKQWSMKAMNEKVTQMELRNKQAQYELKLKVQEMFTAQPYIGHNCAYPTYADFISDQVKTNHNLQERISSQAELLQTQNVVFSDITKKFEDAISQLQKVNGQNESLITKQAQNLNEKISQEKAAVYEMFKGLDMQIVSIGEKCITHEKELQEIFLKFSQADGQRQLAAEREDFGIFQEVGVLSPVQVQKQPKVTPPFQNAQPNFDQVNTRIDDLQLQIQNLRLTQDLKQPLLVHKKQPKKTAKQTIEAMLLKEISLLQTEKQPSHQIANQVEEVSQTQKDNKEEAADEQSQVFAQRPELGNLYDRLQKLEGLIKHHPPKLAYKQDEQRPPTTSFKKRRIFKSQALTLSSVLLRNSGTKSVNENDFTTYCVKPLVWDADQRCWVQQRVSSKVVVVSATTRSSTVHQQDRPGPQLETDCNLHIDSKSYRQVPRYHDPPEEECILPDFIQKRPHTSLGRSQRVVQV